jgi:threonine dehydratase
MFSWKDKGGPPAVTFDDIVAAGQRIHQILRPTPVLPSPGMSEKTGLEVFLKWENMSKTGSFKERGALNALLKLTDKQRRLGVCAASLGNHALALSHHSARLQIPCVIVMPTNAPLVKVQSTKSSGAEVILFGHNFVEAYDHALKISEERGLRFVSAYDDPDVIAGQGTAGLEILDQCPDFDSVIIPVGGGGLASGVSLAIKTKRPEVYIMGVRSDWVTKASALSGSPAPLIPSVSIADGIAVKRPGKLTGPLLDLHVDQIVSLSEAEIADSIVSFLELEHTVVEGAGAVGFGALTTKKLPAKCKKPMIVVSGSNIDMNILSRLIERDMGERGRLLRIVVSVPDRPGSLQVVTTIIARGGANVLEALHDRSFSKTPGNVDITLLLEVTDVQHKALIIRSLRNVDIDVREIE